MSMDAPRLRSVVFCLVLAGWVVSTAASAQPSHTSVGAASLTKARTALQAGKAADAIELADSVLSQQPADADALAIKIDALISLDAREKALDAYDAWFRASRVENPKVAGRLGRAELEALTKQDVAAIQVEAFASLAAEGNEAARTRLEQTAWANPPTSKSWPAIVALARTGDKHATARVLQAARESTGSGLVEALQAVGRARISGAEGVLREALASRDAMVQSAAADTIARLGLKVLTADVIKLAQSGDPLTRFSAAAALADLGDSAGDAFLKSAMSSPASDVRLRAAAALSARGDKTWADQVRPLLADPDGLTRFQAAELLLDVDRPAAMKVLTAGTTDTNAAIRVEVARILTADPAFDLSELRRLLRDGASQVRLEAARALVERTRPDR
jgi:HEAT repeat protein